MLRNVQQQPYDVLKEWAHVEPTIISQRRHYQVFHHMDDLSQALEVLEGRPGVSLIPVDLAVVGPDERVLKHSKILLLEVFDEARARGIWVARLRERQLSCHTYIPELA